MCVCVRWVRYLKSHLELFIEELFIAANENEGQQEMTSCAHSLAWHFSRAEQILAAEDGWLPDGMNALGVAHGKSSS